MFQRAYCRADVLPGAHHRLCVCIMTVFSFRFGMRTPDLCIPRSPLKERPGAPVHSNSYSDLDDWDLGQWCKAQAVSAAQVDVVLFVDSLIVGLCSAYKLP